MPVALSRIWCVAACAALARLASAEGVSPLPAPLARSVPALDLDVFDDDDCLEVPNADLLLTLMYELCDLLDVVLFAPDNQRESAWTAFGSWAESQFSVMIKLAGSIFSRPYCEPGKVSWMATECLLLLRNGDQGEAEALDCAVALDEDLWAQMTPRGDKFITRFHLVLRSPWPAFRLLDLLVRLHPENGSTRMGACKSFTNWRSDPDIFDWSRFKPLVTNAVDAAAFNSSIFELQQEDGPLSRQYRSRWLRLHDGAPGLREAISFSDDVFDVYREHHYKAGCHLGVISSYILQVLLVHLHDVEGRLHRYVASVANLINYHAPFSHAIKSDWPVFRLLHLVSLMQRTPPRIMWRQDTSADEPRAPRSAARALSMRVAEALPKATATQATSTLGCGDDGSIVFLTAAWGALSRFAGRVLTRWEVTFAPAPLVFLALDSVAKKQCLRSRIASVSCVDAPLRLGVEGIIAKYLAMATITQHGIAAVWFDLDVYMVSRPVQHACSALALPGQPDLVFAKHHMSESLSPALVVARDSPTATDLLMRYAGWLRENPYLLDHRGWDQFLTNRAGDFAGGFDYQGRNVTLKDDKGPMHSFLPKVGLPPPGTRYAALGSEQFGSGDGWTGDADGRQLAFFHFWAAVETQEALFELFYPHSRQGIPRRASAVLAHYHREPAAAPRVLALLRAEAAGANPRLGMGRGRALHLVAVSYADGCCRKSLQRNRRKALEAGVDEARAYGRANLGAAWATKHRTVLQQKRGGGWWLWKPYVILQTLKDPAVPWHRGVVIWVDAGNYIQADPRALTETALWDSDVSAMRLKWCAEADWTSVVTMRRLNVTERYAVVDRPQLGAYFLLFRKTPVAISFVEEWLRLSEDAEALLGDSYSADLGKDGASNLVAPSGAKLGESPNFQKHQADQSIFSVLFKEYGFRALSLEEGHRVVTLERWRE